MIFIFRILNISSIFLARYQQVNKYFIALSRILRKEKLNKRRLNFLGLFYKWNTILYLYA